MTGPTMPFDAFTGDTIHQYFQMVQQVDCAIDAEHVSNGNPDRLSPRPSIGRDHDLQHASGQHAARRRPDDGILQHAETATRRISSTWPITIR